MKCTHIRYVFSALIGILFLLCAYRAMTMSMTHDESGTYLFWHDQAILPFLYEPSLWTSANNHLLNTQLFQISEYILGFSDFSIRLPNVLSWLIYGFSCLVISHIVYNKIPSQVIFLSLILLNPYAFDFFSICRGYGLSLAFLSAALLLIFLYYKRGELTHLISAYICLLFSALAILSHAILLPVFAISIVIVDVITVGLYKARWVGLISFLFLCLSCIILYTPIMALSAGGELAYGNQSLWTSWTTLVQDSLMGKPYVGNHTDTILAVTILVIITIGIILRLACMFKYGSTLNNYRIHGFLAVSFVTLLSALLLSHLILGNEYPINRKSLFLLPIGALLLSSAIDLASSRKTYVGFSIVVFILSLLHFVNTTNLNHTREWWYDSHTKQYIYKIANLSSDDDHISIGCHWLFHPTLSYYQQMGELKNLQIQPYLKDIDLFNSYDYFISTSQEIHLLESEYDVVKKSSTDAILWRKK